MKKYKNKGFTLVELVIVIAIVAILAAVLIPTFSGVVENANKSAAMQEARNEYTKFLTDDSANLDGGSYAIVVRDRYIFFVENGAFQSTGYALPSAAAAIATVKVGAADVTITGNSGAVPTASEGYAATAVPAYGEQSEEIALYRIAPSA